MTTYDNKSFGSIYVNNPILILVLGWGDVLSTCVKVSFCRGECHHQIFKFACRRIKKLYHEENILKEKRRFV